MNNNFFYSTTSKGLQKPEEPPRDDLEAAERGGGAHVVPKPTAPEPLSVDRESVLKAQMFAEKSRADLLAEKLKTSEVEVRKLRDAVRKARRDAAGYRRRLRATEDELETERAKVAHLRGIAGRIEEDEAA